MKINPILECKILCYNKAEIERQKDLGMNVDEDSTDTWQDFAIDLRNVVAIRAVKGDDDQQMPSQCFVHIEYDYFRINVPYKEVLQRWKEAKNE